MLRQLQLHLAQHNLNFIFNSEVVGIKGKESVQAVCLSNGCELPADLVIIGIGLKPNYEFLKAPDLLTNQGILVNELMETSIPDIFAAGDVPQFYHVNYKVLAIVLICSATWVKLSTEAATFSVAADISSMFASKPLISLSMSLIIP